MLLERILFFLHLVKSQLQINLYLTDRINTEDENLQHDCLYVPAYTRNESDPRQIISYCMGQFPSKFQIKENNIDQKLTFDELSKQNITSQQLYHWSAPIDLIEQYQFYLTEKTSIEKTNIFYNCTLPYFGPKCEYVLNDYKSHNLSLDDFIHNYYRYNRYEPTLLTCYIHLECNRGPFPSCLDWTEICDGKIDCLNDGIDEEHCWQLEIHQCNENEYQCSNGQCIPKLFYRDDSNNPDCLDQSDEVYHRNENVLIKNDFLTVEPVVTSEDVSCEKTNNIQDYPLFLTSSCDRERHNLLAQAMFSIKPSLISNECWTAMKCIMKMPAIQTSICEMFCADEICNEIIQKTCPDIIYVPTFPLFFGHIYLAYNKAEVMYQSHFSLEPTHVCYNDQLLHVPADDKTFLLFNNKTCRHYVDSNINADSDRMYEEWIETFTSSLYKWLHKNTISIYNNSALYDRSMMYKCMNSLKYISKSRLFDGVCDCYYDDDEQISRFNINCSEEENPNYFKCKTTNECIPRNFVKDGPCHCTDYQDNSCDDEYFDISYARNTISFQTICDSFPHLLPKSIDDQNETDETNCEQWPLIHIYNRCDGFWHNHNGSDEINCYSSSLLNCSTNHHICVSPETNESMCLPIEKTNDGIIDCLGGADEPTICKMYLTESYPRTFICENDDSRYCINIGYLCDGSVDCPYGEDERACKSSDIREYPNNLGICMGNYELDGSDVTKILCRHFSNTGERWRIYFTLDQRQNLNKQNLKDEISPVLPPQSIQSYQQRCHRGLDLQVWLDKEKNLTTNACLCPPSYYGDICQYQNERIVLTLQFGVASDSLQTPFIIIISLIDDTNEQIIHSYEQLTYLPMKNCRRKYNIYLLYSTRPKNSTKQYFIHVDIYDSITLNYRASIIKLLNYSFLPVQRLALHLDIPHVPDETNDCLDDQCINGKCIKYSDDLNNSTFCQCNSGWSGRYCTIQHSCTCSSNSLCIGKLANNRSLCVCPLNKMGPRCLIDNIICQNNTCLNGGQCIPVDEYEIFTNKFTCICKGGFTGDRCEINRTKLIISFDKNITLPSLIRVHFIEVKDNDTPVRTTTVKKSPFGEDSITVFWSLPFHIVFVELSNKSYYLISIQKLYKQSTIIKKLLNSSDRCLHINELFNETIANYSLLRRIKYYHLPCQSELSCFYDEYHLCLCQQLDQQRVANCLDFDHNTNLNCSDHGGCENGGQCLQENTTCPRVSICVCPVCFSGNRCQFSTNVFSFSLDAILSYHIQPNINISRQPFIVLISLIITVIITLLGFINGILVLITFKNKITRESGCGIYLLTSSIITLLIMIIFISKFLILLFSQMRLIENKLFLNIQCHSIDFLLRSCLTMDQWLTAFIAIERAFIIIKGICFNKNKSKSIAKWIISVMVLITIITNIHDPIYRTLFEEYNYDEDEKRIWCIVKYSSDIQIFDLVGNIFHLVLPFIINIISAIIIIIMNARQRAAIQKKQKYNKILNEQIQQHKNLLISPCILVILGIPRLIISFTLRCMNSSSDTWLFLLGYAISLIPPLLTFILFVLPSTTYTQAFKKAISQYRNIIKRR